MGRGGTGVTTRLGVTLRTWGRGRGVRNGFCIGDGGAEGGTVGIHVKDVIDSFVKSVIRSIDIEGLAHWRRWVDLYASRTSGAFLKCSSGSHVDSAREYLRHWMR